MNATRNRYAVLFTVVLLALATARLAAAPFDGQFNYRQPDGTVFPARVVGDEFYADEETADGYRIVRDPGSGFWCYARLDQAGRAFVSTGVRVGSAAPAGLRKHLRLPQAERRRLHAANRARMEVDDHGRPLPPDAPAAPAGADPVLRAPPSSPTLGARRGLTLLVQFPDRPGDVVISRDQVDAFCNQMSPHYSEFGNNGSVAEYFYEVSNGKLTYTNQVPAYFTAANNRDYYTDPAIALGTRARELIIECLNALEASDFDFRTVDLDSNGYIDGINCFYAGGRVNNWSEGLWPHAWTVSWLSAKTNIRSSRYQITDMGSSLTLGTFCHENGHMICRFPDIYDYDYDSSGGAGTFCLMNSGGHGGNPVAPCGYLRYKAGWGDSTTITSSTNQYFTLTAEPGGDGRLINQFLIYALSATEYYLIENRYDHERDSGLPTSGVAIWHCDQLGDRDDQRYAHQTSHENYECALIQADNQRHFERDASNGDSQDLFYAGNGASGYLNAFHDSSDAGGYDNNAHWWDGANSGLRASLFTARGNTASFMIGSGALVVTAPNGGESYAAGSSQTVTWTSYGTVGNVTIQVSTDGGGAYTDLSTDTANDGSQTVTMPATASSTCLLQVRQYAGAVIADVSNGYFTLTGGAQELDVSRTGDLVPNGGVDPVTATVSGWATALTYQLANPGGASLDLNGAPLVAVGSQTNCAASVTALPATPVAAGASTTFTVAVTPAATGAWSFTLAVASTDGDENPYAWTVSGTAVAQPEIDIRRGAATIADGGTDILDGIIPGSSNVLYYRILNTAATGAAQLLLTGAPAVQISGQANCTATVTVTPMSWIDPGFNTACYLTFSPTAAGPWRFTVTIANNDANENPYDFTVRSTAVNNPPVIDSPAWADPNPVTLPAGTTVQVTASDPDGNPLTYAWSQVSGPGTPTFATPSAAASAVTFGVAGSYVLRVTVSDDQGDSVTSDVTVTVNPGSGVDPRADVNHDGVVNALDLQIIIANFGKTVGAPDCDARADANSDGVVNALDLQIVIANFGQTVP